MPALTQCALAHVNGNIISPEEYRVKLSMLETSSPSYLLLSSIEECLDIKLDYWDFINKRDQLVKNCNNLKSLKLLDYDISRLIVFTGYSDISGIELAEKLRDSFNIEVEMAAKNYIVLITTACDNFKNYKKLEKALFKIDEQLKGKEYIPDILPSIPEKANESLENKELIDFDASLNRVSAESIWAYPPGIPIIVSGEIISQEIIDYVNSASSSGVNIQSTFGFNAKKIYCQS